MKYSDYLRLLLAETEAQEVPWLCAVNAIVRKEQYDNTEDWALKQELHLYHDTLDSEIQAVVKRHPEQGFVFLPAALRHAQEVPLDWENTAIRVWWLNQRIKQVVKEESNDA